MIALMMTTTVTAYASDNGQSMINIPEKAESTVIDGLLSSAPIDTFSEPSEIWLFIGIIGISSTDGIEI